MKKKPKKAQSLILGRPRVPRPLKKAQACGPRFAHTLRPYFLSFFKGQMICCPSLNVLKEKKSRQCIDCTVQISTIFGH
jgi:hypothetical protein